MTMIGLEIHCQLTNLKSKLFCSCKANYREYEPNTNICPVCIGLPGSLPRLNKQAVEKATIIAMALNCQTPNKIAFFRKNYFYPDLPKNFQITQLNIYGDTSIGSNGSIMVGDKKIRITRIQLEEDPGRLIYEGSSEKTQITLVDYNRAGTPLVEIVTEPDFENEKQVRLFLNILSDLLDNLDVSNPSLDGAMRADGNVSIEGGNKVEIKNVNSFHDLEKALHFEIIRQESLVSRNIPIEQETRHWDDRRKITVSARSKEGEEDYRYFLEGDIPWIIVDKEVKEKLKSEMPETSSSIADRLINEYTCTPQVSNIISTNAILSKSFDIIYDNCVPAIPSPTHTISGDNKKQLDPNDKEVKSTFGSIIGNLLTTNIMALQDFQKKLNEEKFLENISELVNSIVNKQIPPKLVNDILHKIHQTNKDVQEILSNIDYQVITDISEILQDVNDVFTEESKAVEQAKTNPETINYLVGKVMKKTKGKADPQKILELIREKLNS